MTRRVLVQTRGDPVNPVPAGTVAPRGMTLEPLPFHREPLTPLPEVRESNGIDVWDAWDKAWAQWAGAA